MISTADDITLLSPKDGLFLSPGDDHDGSSSETMISTANDTTLPAPSTYAYTVRVNMDSEILNLDCFRGKTCFATAHSQEYRGLWNEMTHTGENVFRGNTTVRGKTYDISRSHPIYKKL